MAATVLPLNKPAQKTIPATRRSTRAVRAIRRQAGTAVGIGAVAVTLTTLSLSHLARGITIVTGCQSWEGWAMAVGIDLGFVALELSQLAINDKVRKQVGRFARPAILGTLAGSAAMNWPTGGETSGEHGIASVSNAAGGRKLSHTGGKITGGKTSCQKP